MNNYFITIIFFFVCLGQNIFCETISLSDGDNYVSLKERIEIAEDPGGKTDINEIINDDMSSSWNKKFIKYNNYEIEASGKKVFWIRFDVKNDSINSQSEILEFDYYRNYTNIELFMIQQFSIIDKKKEIPGMDNSRRDLKYRNTVFMLTFPGSSIVTVYLRMEITCDTVLNFYLHDIKGFLSKNRSEQFFWGVFLGVLLIMAFYNLFLFFSFHDTSYLYLSFFSFILVITQVTSTGIISENITFLQGFDDKIFSISISCSVIFFILFTHSLLEIKKYLPKFDLIILTTCPVLIIISTITIFSSRIEFVFIRNRLIFIFCLLLEIQAVIIAFKGSRKALYYLLITGILSVSVIVNIFHRYVPILHYIASALPDTVSVGYIALVSLFSFYLTGSIQTLQKEKINEREKSIVYLEKVNRMKDDFLANTSHELRTPLHGIIGLSESLINKEKLDGNVRDSLSLISASGKRLFNLINDILDFSKMKNNGLSLEIKNISLQPLIDQVIRFGGVLIGKKDIMIRNNTPAYIPPVKGDENRILQILYNLVGNAVKFTSHGFIDIDCRYDDTHAVVTIKDTGIGIDEEDLDEIFTPFYQADAGTDRSFPGTGIGLSIAKQLVELHGGELKVSSQKNAGTEFSFSLPLSENKETPHEQPFITDKTGSPIFEPTVDDFVRSANSAGILAVDDDPINIYILQSLLAGENYKVYTAQDGEQAYEILENEKKNIDLVLLDVMMPSVSGYDLCRRIRSQYKLYEKPVLLLTARQREEDLFMGFESGANDYLTKPFNTVELLSRVKSLIRLKKITMENDILESSNTLKTRLMHMASHGLKNPLTIINGNVSLLLQDSSLGTKTLDLVMPAKDACDKMLCLIREFLENAMIEEGKLMLDCEIINVGRLINKSMQGLKPKADLKKQKLLFDTGEPLWINADETYFLEILDNIIGNGIKYSPSGKRIWISCYRSINNGRSSVTISVRDEGPGMTKDDIEKAFTPFSILSAKPTGDEFSTGLGLATTRQLVELHGGSIEIKSDTGCGCEFLITFPECKI